MMLWGFFLKPKFYDELVDVFEVLQQSVFIVWASVAKKKLLKTNKIIKRTKMTGRSCISSLSDTL